MYEEDGHYSLIELSNLLKVNRQRLAKILSIHSILGVEIRDNRYIIPFNSLTYIKELVGFSDKYSQSNYETFQDIISKLNLSGINNIDRHFIVYKLEKYKIDTLSHLGTKYIHSTNAEILINLIKDERNIPVGYFSINDISHKTKLGIHTITRWALNKQISTYMKVLNGSLTRIASLVDVQKITEQLANSKKQVDGYVTINEAATMMKCSKLLIIALIKDKYFKEVISDSYNTNYTKIRLHEVYNYIDEHYCNATQVAKELGVWFRTITKLLKSNKVDGVFHQSSGTYLIPKRAIPEIKKLSSFSDNFTLLGHTSFLAIIIELNKRGYSKVQNGHIYSAIKKINIKFIIHIRTPYLTSEDATRLIEFYISERTLPEEFLTVRAAAIKANMNYYTVLDWAEKGKIESSLKASLGRQVKIVKWADIEVNLNINAKIRNDHDTLSIKEASKLLEDSRHVVTKLIIKGKLKAWKGIYGWAISKNSINDYLEERQAPKEQFSKEKALSDLINYIENSNTPVPLVKTKMHYKEFVENKINNIQGRENHIKSTISELQNLYNAILLIFKYNIFIQTQFEEILKTSSIPQYMRKTLISFFNFSCIKENIIIQKVYIQQEKRNHKNPSKDTERYSPKIFNLYENYAKDIDFHLPLALKSRHHSNMWIYVIMLLTDCWRPGDIICEMPNFDLQNLNISSFDWFIDNRLTEEHCYLILNQLNLKIKFSVTGKTGADLMLLIIPELEMPLAYAIIISELHRNQVKKWEIEKKKSLMGTFWIGATDETVIYFTTVRNSHLMFFQKYPQLREDFSAKKLNNSTMTYLFCYLVENGDEDASIAIDFPQLSRSHSDPKQTVVYIKTTNKDGTIDRVSINLFKRGHFGWIYNYMIQYATDSFDITHSLEERSVAIDSLRNEMLPTELEEWALSLIEIKNRKHSTVQRLIKMKKIDLQILIMKVYRGQLPSKDGCGQCLIHPECLFPQKKKCFGCNEFIPQYQVLAEAVSEFHRLVNSLAISINESNLQRDTTFLLNVLLLLNEACIAFGKEKVNAYLPELVRTEALNSISNKLRINPIR